MLTNVNVIPLFLFENESDRLVGNREILRVVNSYLLSKNTRHLSHSNQPFNPSSFSNTPQNSRVLGSKMSEFIRKNEKDHQFTWNFSKTDCACILCHRCSLHRSSLVMNINGRVCNAFVFCFLLILCYVFILFRSSSKLDCSVKSEMVKYWNCEHESDVSSINKSKLVNLCTYTLCAWIDKTIVDNVLHRL